jgi:hypothetical protein
MFHFDLDDFIMPDEFVPGEPLQPVPGDNRPNKYRILSKESSQIIQNRHNCTLGAVDFEN